MKLILCKRTYLSANCLYAWVVWLAIGCTPNRPANQAHRIVEVQITPAPVKQLYKRDYFTLQKTTRVLLNLTTNRTQANGTYLIEKIRQKCHYKLKISDSFSTYKQTSSIALELEEKGEYPTQGFKLAVGSHKVVIEAGDNEGLYYGIQLFINLIERKNGKWLVPQTIISDYPVHPFRGLWLNLSDTTRLPKNLESLLLTNRINHIINPIPLPGLPHIKQHKATSFWKAYCDTSTSIQQFYTHLPTRDTLVFNLSFDQLHPDSLAILGEAMWSQPQAKNLPKLLERLQDKH